MVPAVASKVREAVKAQVTASYRNSFETALLPAFEAGAKAMFEQVR